MVVRWVLVSGPRDWRDEDSVETALFGAQAGFNVSDAEFGIIHGGCPTGVDDIANLIAARRGWTNVKVFFPQWNRYGRAAGPKRNEQMIVEGRPDFAVVGQPGPNSRGTAGCLKLIVKYKVPHSVFQAHYEVNHHEYEPDPRILSDKKKQCKHCSYAWQDHNPHWTPREDEQGL